MNDSSNPAQSRCRLGSSFRDPNGFVFEQYGIIYRQIHQMYRQHYDHLMQSGLYDALEKQNLLISHEEVEKDLAITEDAYCVIRPIALPFVSYPYEWCFGQLKDAALTTLRVQLIALKHGMILKDASAYNIQFVDGHPVFVDTLSFEKYEEGLPWVAYRQFCQHFLAPLLLMSYKDIRLSQLLRVFIDGIPLDLTSSLLPKRSYLKLGVLLHVHLHARTQRRYADVVTRSSSVRKLSRTSLINIVNDLQATIRALQWNTTTTAWANYYEGDSYQESGFEDKKTCVSRFIEMSGVKTVWDLGSNTGIFSRLAVDKHCYTVAWDIDPGAVERNYQKGKHDKEELLLPLVLDLTNPSPAIGWAYRERMDMTQRSKTDLIMALALIHHLAIGNNIPLDRIAEFFASLATWAIVEFVPKNDHKVQKLLATRSDIFPSYTRQGFEDAFGGFFDIVETHEIRNSSRLLYLMKRT